MASYKGRVTPPGYPKKQSTPSRAKHSSSIFAPFIRVDIYSSTKAVQKQKRPPAGLVRPAGGLGTRPMRPQAGPATMTSTIIIIMTTGIERWDGVSMRRNRFVEPLDMRNFPECTLQVLEMQDGVGIRNVYWGIRSEET